MRILRGSDGATLAIGAVLAAALGYWVFAWENRLTQSDFVVVYFGRPTDILGYLHLEWAALLSSIGGCVWVSIASLVLAGVLSVVLLTAGLLSEGGVKAIERIAAMSQTVPTLVIVTVSLLLETQLFAFLGIKPSTGWYCVVPVTIALMFPPLVNGAGAINRVPIELKAMLRLWDASRLSRVRRVYLPLVMPDILTGVRSSATWAVGATLIAEGLIHGVSGDADTLGHFLMRPFSTSQHAGRTPAAIIVATALGFTVYYLFVWLQAVIERRLYGDVAIAEIAYPLQSR